MYDDRIDTFKISGIRLRYRGKSLSSLIEVSLREVVGDERRSFASRWRGQFRVAEHDHARYVALAHKYLR